MRLHELSGKAEAFSAPVGYDGAICQAGDTPFETFPGARSSSLLVHVPSGTEADLAAFSNGPEWAGIAARQAEARRPDPSLVEAARIGDEQGRQIARAAFGLPL